MPIKYKKDILAALKEKGYSSTRIRNEKIIGQSYLQQLRHGEMVSWKTIETICRLLNCQPGDLLEYVEVEDKKLQEESPKPIKSASTETESFEEQLKRII
ncbi:MAG TPA: Cro/Cl family transcriptional regulator [Ruminococcaceae bacterium]|nr:Cro/Cl family transcriptional regulator [Oscillospiraceae bacterium]